MQLTRLLPLLLALGCARATDGDDAASDASDVDTDVEDSDAPDPVETAEPPLVCASEELGAALGGLGGWTDVASCGRLWFGAVSATANHAVRLNLTSRQTTFAVGEEIGHDFGAPRGQAASLQVAVGTGLVQVCTTERDTDVPQHVARAWDAVAGTATFTVTAVGVDEGEGQPFEATLALRGVVLEAIDATGDRCPLPDQTWEGLDLGTLPGG